MFCTACAAVNPVAAARCLGCGRPLSRPAGKIGPAEDRQRGARQRRAALLILVPLLALLAIGGGYLRAEQADRAAWYARAAAAEAAGRYPEALDAYAAAGDHRDAGARHARLTVELAPARDAYRRGAAAIAAGRHEAAIAELLPVVRALPGHAEAAGLLAEARRLRLAELRRDANAAIARRDWLAAEAALAALAAADPGDTAVAARLASLQREHAPLVFARDRALYLASPDGADERLLTDAVPVARPVWSPDRRSIAFVSSDPNATRGAAALYVVGADGSGLRRLVGSVHPSALPAWSPDGTRLAYTSVAAYSLRRDQGLLAVHVVEVATGRDADVTGGSGRHGMAPTWSPAGDRLAFLSRPLSDSLALSPTNGPGDVSVLTLATGEVVDLTAGRLPNVIRAHWSPTADQLLLYAGAGDTGSMTGGAGIDLYELDASPAAGAAGRPATLTRIVAGIDSSPDAWAPAWSPDGARVTYADGPTTVVIRDRDGRETRVETEDTLSGGLTWSPDGGALLAVAADPSRPSTVVAFDADPPTQSALLLPFDTDWPTGTPQWSPVLPAPPPPVATLAGTALDAAASGPGAKD